MSVRTCINSAIGFREAPPVSPECVSTVAVSSVRMKPSNPRNPAELAGRLQAYSGLEVVVVRALSERAPQAVLEVARAAT